MRRRALVILLGTLSLAACVAAEPQFYPEPLSAATPPVYPVPKQHPHPPHGEGGQVAILLPLTGSNARLGQAMLNAARLALAVPGAPGLDVRDTGGTPQGAESAAAAAVMAGDRIILGPLTAGETQAAAGPAHVANVPVLAFTSDPAVAQPGVWTLGLTPGQQVRRLLGEAVTKGHRNVAALLPDNAFGHLMESALVNASLAAGLSPPAVRQYPDNTQAMLDEAKDLTNFIARRPGAPAPAEVPPAGGAAAVPPPAAAPVAPPPFNALLLAATGGELGHLGWALGKTDVTPAQVQILGPALWAHSAARAPGGTLLDGAWYAAPDPASRAQFVAQYQAKYGASPPLLADLAYDAAAIARLDHSRGWAPGLLTRTDGFAGVDGLVALMPDGQVRRALAVFVIHPGGTSVLDPPPAGFGGPGA